MVWSSGITLTNDNIVLFFWKVGHAWYTNVTGLFLCLLWHGFYTSKKMV